jgi:hypothetical protein
MVRAALFAALFHVASFPVADMAGFSNRLPYRRRREIRLAWRLYREITSLGQLKLPAYRKKMGVFG